MKKNIEQVGKFVIDVHKIEKKSATTVFHKVVENQKVLVHITLLEDGRKHISVSSNVAVTNSCSDDIHLKYETSEKTSEGNKKA